MEEIELQPLINGKFTPTTFTSNFTPSYWKYILGFICLIILIFTFSYNIYINYATRDATYKREGLQI